MVSSASDSDDEDSDGFSFVTSSTFGTFSLVLLLVLLLTQKMMKIILIWTFSQVSPLQGFPLQTWFLPVSDSDDEDSDWLFLCDFLLLLVPSL